MDLKTIITSAVVGALVATVGQLIGQALERRHRERELVFRFSIEAARAKRDNTLLARKETGRASQLRDPLYIAAEYYPLVQHLMHKGSLPDEAPPERPRP